MPDIKTMSDEELKRIADVSSASDEELAKVAGVDLSAKKDLLDTLAGGSPEENLKTLGPNISAIQQTGKDLVSIPASFANMALFNAPKSLLETLTPYKYPAPSLTEKTNSPVAGVLAKASGVVGLVKSPLTELLSVKAPEAVAGNYPLAEGVLGKMGIRMTPQLSRFLTGAAIGGAWSPEKFTDVHAREMNALGGGILNTALPAVGDKAVSMFKAIPETMTNTAAGIDNFLIKALPKDFAYSKNAGRGLAKLGVVGKNFVEFAGNIADKITKVSDDLNLLVKSPDNVNKVVNVYDALQPLRDALAKEQAALNPSQNVIDTLTTILNKTGKKYNVKALRPTEVLNLKRDVAEATKFTGNPSDDKTINLALKMTYGGIKDKLTAAVPKSGELSSDLADLLTAKNAVKKRVLDSQVPKMPWQSLGPWWGKTAIAGGAGALTHNPAVFFATLLGEYGLEGALRNPEIASKLASTLYSGGQSAQQLIEKTMPQFAQAVTKKYGSMANFIQSGVKFMRPTNPSSLLDEVQNSISGRMNNIRPKDNNIYMSDLLSNKKG